MKQLFITHKTEDMTKENRQKIFLCSEKKEEKIENIESPSKINIPENPLNILNTNISSSSSTSNSSFDSRKISFNTVNFEQQFNSGQNFSVNSNSNPILLNSPHSFKFLAKKTNSDSDSKTNEEKVEKKSNSNKTFKVFNTVNIQKEDDAKILKEIVDVKSESLDLEEEKENGSVESNKEDDVKFKIEKNGGKTTQINEGRWSIEEHLKFIEAIVEFGKNWQKVQKYIGSRTISQIRSHAQKFLLKIKSMKNHNPTFDLRGNNIKHLSDIIELIKQKKEYSNKGNNFIINTLINLSETISCEIIEPNHYIKKKNKKEEAFIVKHKNQESKTNGSYNEKLDEFNGIQLKENENLENIKDNGIENQNNQDKNELNNHIKIDLSDKESINKVDIKEQTSSLINNDLNNNSYSTEDNCDSCHEKENKFIFDDDIMYLKDDTDFFNMNNNSLKIKEYFFLKNFESPYLIHNKYFFS